MFGAAEQRLVPPVTHRIGMHLARSQPAPSQRGLS